ncbi:cytidylate kinase [Geotalea uraniireducens]|uniref:Cytidylate kinase n=1 Tax=Geotalea uraniireducens TaxID=351604 RepID=A0ABM8END8_9BACT|nr:(d)CMP kinase [Geotalea uraniireducens]BDV44114.1 cytidylate kinase [Geotalea uraniireducens]
MNGAGKRGLIIAIDGPSGAGKSTITKQLADRLGYIHIDTGAMFRAVALAASRAGINVDDDAALAGLCRGMEISFVRDNGCCRVVANGEDVSAAIRTPEISLLTSAISARKVVRDFLLGLQRRMGCNGGVILEGRDIGTVVFPDAEVKFYLSASAEERGRRRWLELTARGEAISLEETIAAVVRRDRQDSGREHAPLKRADDAIDIDSTGLTIEEVLDRMEACVRDRERQFGFGGERSRQS